MNLRVTFVSYLVIRLTLRSAAMFRIKGFVSL